MKDLLRWLHAESAVILYLLGAGLAVGVAFGVTGITTDTSKALITIATGLFTVAAVFTTRSNGDQAHIVQVVTAAFTTGLTALAAFGLHLAPQKVSVLTVLLAAVLSLILRGHVSPVPLAGHRAAHQQTEGDI
jgi:hypothetical protein